MERFSSTSGATLPAVPLDADERPATILIVEDEQVVLGLLKAVLGGLGHQILVAVNGEEDLQVSQEHGLKIDLLITDLMLPGMGGRTLAAAIRSSQPAMEVLFMSGYPQGSGPNCGAQDKFINFVEKPFTPATIATKVRDLLTKAG